MADLIHKHKVAAPGQEITVNFEDLMLAQRASLLQAALLHQEHHHQDRRQVRGPRRDVPAGPSGKIGLQAITDQLVINAKTQNKEAAWELVKMLCSKEVGVRLGGGTGGVGVRHVGRAPRRVHRSSTDGEPAPPDLRGAGRERHAIRFPANLREEEVASAVHQTLMPIWLGERPADDAFFAQLNSAVQGVLDQPIA